MSMSVLSLQLRGTSARPILIDLYTFGQNIEDYICSRLHLMFYVLYQCSANIKVIFLKNCNVVGCGDDGDASDGADGAVKHLVHRDEVADCCLEEISKGGASDGADGAVKHQIGRASCRERV